MRSTLVSLCLAIFALSAVAQQADTASGKKGPPAGVIALLNKGRISEAEQMLRNHLKQHPDDQPTRGLLGQVLDFDGRPNEAIKVWEAGLRGKEADFPLLMSIGELRARQGRDGPTLTRSRGTLKAQPNRDPQASQKFKEEHLTLAAEAFQKALDTLPNHREASLELAKVYSELQRHDDALKVWQGLHERHATDADLALGLAQALAACGKSDEAAALYKTTTELNPRLAAAHDALAKHFRSMGKQAEAEKSQRQAEFYGALPSFTRLNYSEENADLLAKINTPEAVQKLIEDPSDRATDFLAVLCWSHPHNDLEQQAFDSLEKRGKSAVPIVRQLLADAQSTCTIRSSARILARHKDAGLLDRLLPMLPGDMRSAGFHMDIAGALDELGDPRAIEPLVELLAPEDRAPPDRNSPEAFLYDRLGARARAALALGAFDKPKSREALTKGADHPVLGPYCHAALYRLTRDARHIPDLRKALTGEDRYVAYLVADYLRKVETAEAKKLVVDWEKQDKEERARQNKSGAKAKSPGP